MLYFNSFRFSRYLLLAALKQGGSDHGLFWFDFCGIKLISYFTKHHNCIMKIQNIKWSINFIDSSFVCKTDILKIKWSIFVLYFKIWMSFTIVNHQNNSNELGSGEKIISWILPFNALILNLNFFPLIFL